MDATTFITLALITIVAVLWLLVAVDAVKRMHWGWLIAMVLFGPLATLAYWLSSDRQRPGEDPLPARRSETGEFPSGRDYRR